MQIQPGIVYQFGPFEVNAASGELLMNGRRIRLQEQPYRLLVALLENPGEVVSRENLRSRLWPQDTFVDFDGSLRVAVGKLREALHDDADDPRYIETIPKRGYRFLVTEVRRVDTANEAAELRDGPELLKTGASPLDASQSHNPLLKYGIAALAVLILTTGGVFFWRKRAQAKPLRDDDVLVLADFANTTGEPVFDGALRQGLAVQLEQSPFLSIIPDEKIQQTLTLMGQPVDAKLMPAIAREVCQRTASAAVLDGAIARIGTRYLLTLKAVDCESGKTLASTEAQASDENHVLDALGNVSTEIRNKLGESLSTIQKFDTPLEQATTPSLEALKAYSLGMKALKTKGPDAAAPFFTHAVELDPNFAVAYAYLGIMASTTLEPGLSVNYRTKAFALRDRASEAEKYWITATYHKGVTGDIPKAIEACDLWVQAYPRSELPHIYLGAAVLPVVGQNERAVEESIDGIRLRPDYAIAYGFGIRAYTAVNRYDEAKATYAQALERKLNIPFIDVVMYELAFAQNDTAGMAQHVAKLEALPRLGHQALAMEGDTAAYYGRLNDARELSRRAMDSAQHAGEKDAPALYSGTSSLREAWFGNTGQARRRATLALKLSTGRDLQYFAALAFAYARDDARAKALADDLDKGYPEDTIVQFNYLPTVRGKLALNRGDASAAIASLAASVPYELGGTRAIDLKWTAMFPVFVRGEAYLAARQGGEAAARVPEDPRPSRPRPQPTHRCACPSWPRSRLCVAGKHRQGQGGLSGFFNAMEGRGPRYSCLATGKSRVHEVAVTKRIPPLNMYLSLVAVEKLLASILVSRAE